MPNRCQRCDVEGNDQTIDNMNSTTAVRSTAAAHSIFPFLFYEKEYKVQPHARGVR